MKTNDDFIKNVADISKNIANQRKIRKLARFALENHVEDIFTQERLEKIILWTDETIAVLKEHLFCADPYKDVE